MSFRIERRLTNGQLLEAFEAALKTSEVAMVRQGDALLLEPRAKAKGSAGLATLGGGGVHGVGYETLAVPLAYAAPSEVAKALQAIAPSDIVVYVDDKQGLLILGGDPPELEAAVQMIRTFDHSGLEAAKIRFFELAQAPADTVSQDLDKVLQASGVSGVTVVPLKRLNGLFVFARTASALDQVGGWIAKLDVPSREPADGFFTYHPRNVSAEELSEAITSVLTGRQASSARSPGGGVARASSSGGGFRLSGSASGGQGAAYGGGYGGGAFAGGGAAAQSATPAQTATATRDFAATPGGGEDASSGMRVGFDRGSNTVLVMAPPGRWIQIQKMLQEIDRAPSQVLIEATILEVTLNDQFNLGVDWSVVGADGQLTAQSINNSSGKVGPTTPGLSVTFLGKNLQAAIHALQARTAVEVISNPKILALDNHQAQLQVGDEVPIISQTGQSTTSPGAPVINSVSYLGTGVILDVTPRISGDRIYLDIDQEVSGTTSNTTSGIDSPTIQQRRLQTTLILDNGGLVALGGLISSTKSTGDTGTPWLNRVPILGLLFKSSSKTLDRTELIVLITAKVVNDKASADRVMSDLLADMKEIERRGLLKR
jgi:general secretion pathway protein D